MRILRPAPAWPATWLGAGRRSTKPAAVTASATGTALRRRVIAVGLVLCLIAAPFAVYWPYLRDPFVLDDYIWLLAAQQTDLAELPRVAFAFPGPTPFWRPLVDGYFVIVRPLYGLDPLPYHITNLALHGLNAALLALAAWLLLRSRIAALCSGLIFATLPAYDFAVVWISDITELLGACWYLATVVLWIAFLQGRRHRGLFYALALVCMTLGLLTKESTATLPAVLAGLAVVIGTPSPPAPLSQCWERGRAFGVAGLPSGSEVGSALNVGTPSPSIGRGGWGVRACRWGASTRHLIHRLLALTPFAIITAAYLALMVAHEYRTSAGIGQYRFDLHAAEHLWDYLRLLAFPAPDGWWTRTEQVRTALAAVTLGAGAIALVRRRSLPAVLLGWTLLVLLPYAFFPAGIEYRYTYLGAAPFTLFWIALATAGLHRLATGWRRLPVAAIAGLGVVLLCLWLAAATRERQLWLHEQALAYDQLVREAPSVCGHLPAGSTIYVLNDPVFDLYDESTRAALRLRYQMLDVRRIKDGSMPALGGDAASTCVIAFVDGRYRLVAQT